MAGEGPDNAMTQTPIRTSQDGLLQHAVAVLRMRYEGKTGYPGLSRTAAKELGQVLTRILETEHPGDEGERAQAIALAHRLIDNDNPELSPMWPEASEEE